MTRGGRGRSILRAFRLRRLRYGGRVRIETAPDPRTGRSVRVMDRLDLVHALCQQIPDAGTHRVRCSEGAYANRARRRLAEARAVLAHSGLPAPEAPREAQELLPRDVSFEEPPPPAPPGSAAALRRQACARMIRKVFEVDPLVCPRCATEMEVVAWITQPSVVDAILRHRREHGLFSPHEEARAPPAA